VIHLFEPKTTEIEGIIILRDEKTYMLSLLQHMLGSFLVCLQSHLRCHFIFILTVHFFHFLSGPLETYDLSCDFPWSTCHNFHALQAPNGTSYTISFSKNLCSMGPAFARFLFLFWKFFV